MTYGSKPPKSIRLATQKLIATRRVKHKSGMKHAMTYEMGGVTQS